MWWVDKTGVRPWTDMQNFGFNLLPSNPNPSGIYATLKGSYLVSDLFQLNGSQILTVQATLATAGFKSNNYMDVGFGLLVQQGQTKYVLFALRPDGVNQFGDMGPIGPMQFAPPTPPVVWSTSVSTVSPAVVLGGVDYSNLGQGSVSITTGCKAAAGQYQLVFGMFTGLSVTAGQPSATIVWSVDGGSIAPSPPTGLTAVVQ